MTYDAAAGKYTRQQRQHNASTVNKEKQFCQHPRSECPQFKASLSLAGKRISQYAVTPMRLSYSVPKNNWFFVGRFDIIKRND